MSEELKAGPELDNWIAEHVMGWERRAGGDTYQTDAHNWSSVWCEDAWWDKAGRCQCQAWAWEPSKRIDQAWRVVDRLWEMGFVVSVTVARTAHKQKSILCDLWQPLGKSVIVSEQPTIPIAVCLAAKQALEATP